MATIHVGLNPNRVGYDSGNGYVYVTNQGSNNVSVINGTTLVATVPGAVPYGVAYDSGNGYVYIANTGGVSVFNGTTNVAWVQLGGPSGVAYPFGVAYDSGNGYVYVSYTGTPCYPGCQPGNVSVISGTTVVATVTVGTYPFDVAYDSGNGYVYVANLFSNNVSVISGTTVVATIGVGSGPDGLAYDSGNGYVYVANEYSNDVSVISGTTVVATIAVGSGPEGVGYDSSNGYVYVANYGSDNPYSGNVSVISGTTVVATVTVGVNPIGVGYDSGKGFVYVTNYGARTVSVISDAPNLLSAPQRLVAAPGDGHVDLSWQPPSSDGGSPITGYRIYRGSSSGPIAETLLATVSNVLAYSDTVVTNGVSYYYQVSAENAFGEGPKGNAVRATPAMGPRAPNTLVATPGDGHVDLSWQPPSSDGGSPITGYRIYRGGSSGGETFLAAVADVLTYTDTGLTNGARYYYQVSAVNAIEESSRSAEAYATPGAPTVPQGLQATPRAAGIDLAWEPPLSQGSGPITGYRIYRGTSPGGETVLTDVGNVFSYSDANVSVGTSYFYRISAVNLLGEGTLAPEVSATPQSALGPGNAPFPWTTTAIAAGLVLASAGAVATLLHTRILREELLQRKVRMLIFEYTRANPGASFSRIRDAAGLKNGVAAYHLRVLEKQGLVHSESRQRHRWYYPNGDVSMWRDIPLSSLQSALLNEVRHAPGLGIRDLARAVDRRPSSVAYNVKGLVREKMLRTERVGAKLCCFLGTADSL